MKGAFGNAHQQADKITSYINTFGFTLKTMMWLNRR